MKRKTISKKSAKRWLSRNTWKLAKAEVFDDMSKSLQKQFELCLRSVNYKFKG